MDRNEAIEIVRKNWPDGRYQLSEALETLIPELKESEDEKTRKEIIDFHRNSIEHLELQERDENKWCIEQHKKFIAWLEKRGEWSQEDEDMVEETLYFIREYQQSNRCKDENGMQNSVTCEHWLESLRHHYQWKPTKEQMEAIRQAAEQNMASEIGNILENLLVEIKNM